MARMSIEGGACSAAGHLKIEMVEGTCAVTKMRFSYPLRFIQTATTQQQDGSSCTNLYVLGFGGGVVSGDTIFLQIQVGEGASASIRTQGSTKVFKSVGRRLPSLQQIEISVENGGLLAFLPSHTSCFKDSMFSQSHVCRIAAPSLGNDHICEGGGGSLVLVDWFSCGRHLVAGKIDNKILDKCSEGVVAAGGDGEFLSNRKMETWDLKRLRTKLQLFVGEERILLENLDLHNQNDEEMNVSDKVGCAAIFGLILLAGPRTEYLQRRIGALSHRQRFHERRSEILKQRQQEASTSSSAFFYSEPLVSISKIKDGVSLVRFACAGVEDAYLLVQEILRPISVEIFSVPYPDMIDSVHSNSFAESAVMQALRAYDKDENEMKSTKGQVEPPLKKMKSRIFEEGFCSV